MEVKILGSTSPYPKDLRNGPGYLIKEDNYKILLDCGSGITRLMSFPDDLVNLNIIISHLHKDHYADLGAIAYASYVYHNMGLLKNKVIVYVPDDITLADYNYLMNFGNLHYMEFRLYNNKTKLLIDKLKVRFAQTRHDVKTFATSISNQEGLKVSYSADTGFDTSLIPFIASSDLLICEATFLEGEYQKHPNHLNTIEAGIMALGSETKSLVLTHLWPEHDKRLYLDETKNVFANSYVAEEGCTFKLTR